MLSETQINDYLYPCKNLHKSPSESFFKHTVFGLRAVYKVFGMEEKRIELPEIQHQNNLPAVINKQEVRDLQIEIIKKGIVTIASKRIYPSVFTSYFT